MGKTNVSMHFWIQWQFYLTVLEEEQHKKIDIRSTKNMQHFLQPRFLGNMLRKMLAYRLSKLACGGGSVYQGKTVHTTSTMSAQFQTKERYSNAVNAWVTAQKISVNFLRTNIRLRLKSGNRSVKKKSLSTRTFAGLNRSGSLHAHNVFKSLIDSWRETGQHNFWVNFFWTIKPTHGLAFQPPPLFFLRKTKTYRNPSQPFWFKTTPTYQHRRFQFVLLQKHNRQ